jgi:hypothetical protein
MAIDGFIPTIWSAQLLTSLKKDLVFGQGGVVNTDYEGEIKDVGDTVKINAIGPITVRDYTKNGTIVTPDQLTEAQSFLTIDRAKYFNFMVDDIDAVQTMPKVMGQAMQEASYALANEVDQYLATIMAASASEAVGTAGSPETIAADTDAYNFLIDLKTALDEANVPQVGRFVIIPAWFEGQLNKDDRFTMSNLQRVAGEAVLNGQIRHVAGMDILTSNNVVHNGSGVGTAGDEYEVVAGHRMATSFADQIGKIEAYRPENRFADAVKGLHVYGAKVIRDEALVKLTITRP